MFYFSIAKIVRRKAMFITDVLYFLPRRRRTLSRQLLRTDYLVQFLGCTCTFFSLANGNQYWSRCTRHSESIEEKEVIVNAP